MVKRRSIFQDLPDSYLFPEINRRKKTFLEKNPDTSLISLGVGDTVKPLPYFVAKKMSEAATALGSNKGYSGYGDEQGLLSLREKICERFYGEQIVSDEVYISDGAKSDICRLQTLFGRDIKVALQDPAYPVYLEGSIVQSVETLSLMPSLPENDFFPDLSNLPFHDLLYICHPNNPTGVTYSYEQLQTLVDYAIAHKSIILFDVAYAAFIQDTSVPRSIYEIPNAEKVAIEIGSFSKMAGFSGIRLGWSVVPKGLMYESGSAIWKDWKRLSATIYNGASNIAQYGGLAALEDEGWKKNREIIDQYQHNASRLKNGFEALGQKVFGGVNAPYFWVHYPERDSWDVFQEFLEEKNLIITPGRGFGPSGEHYIRVSAFAHEEEVTKALNVLQNSEEDRGV